MAQSAVTILAQRAYGKHPSRTTQCQDEPNRKEFGQTQIYRMLYESYGHPSFYGLFTYCVVKSFNKFFVRIFRTKGNILCSRQYFYDDID